MRKLIIASILFLAIEETYSQKIESPEVQQAGDDIIITFDMMPRESIKELYEIEIKSSVDNYVKPLKIKQGIVKDAQPGNRLQFVLSGKDNFAEFKGELDFSIRIKMTYSPLRFISPEGNSSQVKGKAMSIKWRGGLDNGKYSLDLYEGNQKVSNLVSNLSSKEYTWNVPKENKNGSFKIRLASMDNPNRPSFSSEFRIKKKFPVLLLIAPAAVIGGVFATMGGGSSPDPPKGPLTLPDPPDPPE